MVQQIEGLNTKLHSESFENLEIFVEAEIQSLQGRTNQDIATRVSERILGRAYKTGCIVPMLKSPLGT